jgi:hypothetical protein
MENDAQNPPRAPKARKVGRRHVRRRRAFRRIAIGRELRAAASGSPNTGEDSLAVLKGLAEVSAIFVGFTYVGGWSYVATYYSTFGLNPLELDLSVPIVSTNFVHVLFSAWWPLSALGVVVIAWALLSFCLKRFVRILTVPILAILLIIASTAGASCGRQRAMNDMLIDSSDLPYVSFSSRLASSDQPPCVDHQTFGSSDCKLLLHSKGTYYFFTPVPRAKDALIGVGSLNVYTLQDPDVMGVRILRGLQRNAEEK